MITERYSIELTSNGKTIIGYAKKLKLAYDVTYMLADMIDTIPNASVKLVDNMLDVVLYQKG